MNFQAKFLTPKHNNQPVGIKDELPVYLQYLLNFFENK